MKTLYIDRQVAHIEYKNSALKIRSANGESRYLPLRDVSRIIISSSVNLSSGLLNQCWQRRISILFLSGRRQNPEARFYGQFHNDAAIRIGQSFAYIDPQITSNIARRIVTAKLRQQARLMDFLQTRRSDGRQGTRAGRKALYRSLSTLRKETTLTLDRIRGLEGAAASGYFKSLIRFFPKSLGFEARKRRPPPDPVNALLSLGYTLATFESGRAALLSGLDPAIGYLHAPAYGRDSMALDIVEVLRPSIDQMVYKLFNQRIIEKAHFTYETDGAVLLGKAGRRHFYMYWEENEAPHIRRNALRLSRILARYFRDVCVQHSEELNNES